MATVIAAHAMLNPQLECSVCYQMFTDPRMLPCGHTFCLKCLQDIVKAVESNSHKITCPTCRAEFQVGSQNLQDLPKNFTVAQLISSLPAASQCVNDSQHDSAQHVCVDCWDALCDTCSKVHTMTKLTKTHTVKLLRDVTTGDIQAHKAQQVTYCEFHPKQEVAFYCDSEACQRFVCHLCTSVKCKSHTCLELSDANDKFITEITNTLKPLQTISNKCDGMIRNICFAIKKLSANHDTVQQHVDTLLSAAEAKLQSLFDKLLEAIKQCRDTAKHTVNKSHSEQMDKLQTSLADKHTQSHNIKQHVASVEHHLTPSSSVFDKSTFINDKLSDIVSETRPAKIPLNTCLHIDISKWKTDMTTWLEKIREALTTATTQLPQLTEHSLVTHSVVIEGQVTSAKHKYNFTVEQLKDGKYGVSVLSVSSEGQLLVGQCEDRQLHVYSAEGSHVTSVNLLGTDTLKDAVWTPRGHILYTAANYNNIVVMTQCGDVIAQTKTLLPRYLSVSTDDVIYLADYKTGVYQSTDDGVTWSHVFKVADGWQCMNVIKVSSDSNRQMFWIAELLKADTTKWRLQVYTVDKQRVGDNVPWRDVTLPSQVAVNLQYCGLTYDGLANIVVKDSNNKAVHMWSVNGQYVCQLVSSQQLVSRPQRVAVDSQRGNTLYVGQRNGTVGVFELTQ